MGVMVKESISGCILFRPKGIFTSFSLIILLLIPALSFSATNLHDAVRQAVSKNPEVLAKWNAFQAATHEQRKAEGANYPRLDLSSRVGYVQQNTDIRNEDFKVSEASLELTQLLFDGFATRYDIKKFNQLTFARYYELLDISETIALEATRSYLDVLKFRHLLDLASKNYDQHLKIFKQVEERVQAGVGRGVDLQQATGRLALAESNRITEATNLHDVSARYLRIIGEIPADQLDSPEEIAPSLPENIRDALRKAFTTHPAFTAAMENLRATEFDRKARKGSYWPRLEFRARKDVGYDRDNIAGSSDQSTVELVMNYNLFRGGSDAATIKQFTSRREEAREQKNKICRNIRQTLDIAYNDVNRLELQIKQLDQHQKSIAKARSAYREQFDIGQRSLLDLLDTENEYFQAKRAYLAATYDYQLARARTEAGMGNLLTSLDIDREDITAPQGLTKLNPDELDPDAICPPIGIPLRGLGTTRLTTPPARLVPPKITPLPVPAPSMAKPIAAAPSKTGPKKVYPAGVPQTLERLEVHFQTGLAKIPKNDLAEIDRIGKLLQEFPATTITLSGHTDSTGTEEFNFRLSRDRAETVRNRLIYYYGIDPARVLITWFSSKRPLASNKTATGRQKNRRTDAQLVITLNKPGDLKKIQGAPTTPSLKTQE